MDYMNLGVTSRKTGLRIKTPIRRDEYSMENIDEFFADEEDSIVGSRRRRGSRRTSMLLKKPLEPNSSHFVGENGFRIPSSAPQYGKHLPGETSQKQMSNENEYGYSTELNHQDVSFLSPVHGSPVTVTTPKTLSIVNQPRYATNFEIPQDVRTSNEGLTIQLTPKRKPIEGYRDVPDLIDDNETTRDSTSFNTSENAILEDEMDDDFEFNSDEDEDREYVDAASKRLSESESTSSLSGDDSNSSTEEDNAALSRRSKKNKNYYDTGSISSDQLDSDEEYIQKQAQDLLPKDDEKHIDNRRPRRVRVPPLEYWRNEKIVYKRTSQKPVLEIEKVITYDDEQDEEAHSKKRKPQPKTRTRPYTYIPTGRPRGRPRKAQGTSPSNAIDPNTEIKTKIDLGELSNSDWLKHGILQSIVNITTDKKSNELIAFAPGLAQTVQSKDTENEKFTLAVLFDKYREKFASGILTLPIDGVKDKNTSFNAFITFYVIQGVVEVILSDSTFVCVEGSTFQVPAFNDYAFKNIGKNEAKMFFVQVIVPEDFDGSKIEDDGTSPVSSEHGLSSSNMSLTSP
ncbi:HBR015Cp [Eremothecium sinecaudum]|uniref:CENP-C homolog n=1 Tax=Eremothecium sinecaudum TaxID=45286 RepID=A0A120K131_9SACH|nr:HBR015Cp [Eremothecium sinecaudum]AMD18916.1 HBR015Cp [Eremothecium sinecaudum]